MSRSLAFVGILAMAGVAIAWRAGAQDSPGQTTSGVVVKNHISDTERDRLMRDAMEKARKELEQRDEEKQKALEQQAETDKRREEAAKLAEEAQEEARQAANKKAEQAKKDAAAEQKAKEERLAKELAEAEKQSAEESENAKKSSDDAKVTDLDSVKSDKSDSKSKETAQKSESKNEDNSSKDEKKPAKTVIETVSTKEPGSALSVKTTMPKGDDAREVEQRQAMQSDRNKDPVENRESGNELSVSGQVVGLMRSATGQPRLLVNTEDRRMMQVVLEDSDAEVPAPGAVVSIRGRDIGGGNGRQVISARSVSIKSGSHMTKPQQPQHITPEAMAPVPMGPMMPPPMGVMPGPLPMMPGMPGMPGPFPPGRPF